MCNSIFIGKETVSGAKDGEEISLNIKGVYHTDENGVRKLDVMEVDGDPVMDPDEEESDCGCGEEEDVLNQNSDDALKIFLIKKQNKKD